MTIKRQRDIKFINDCGCKVDFGELADAIKWKQISPTLAIKHIYMHGRYPCVSIGRKKWHIHRLLVLYWTYGSIKEGMHVHHINGDRLDARKSNLTLIDGRLHLSIHNKGKTISNKVRESIIKFNHSRKGRRMKPKRKDVTPKMVFEYITQGYSFNKISKITGLDWGCVKQRYNDFIHDNPEFMKGGQNEKDNV